MDSSKTPSDSISQIPVDPSLTLALAQASVAAYADYEGKPVVPPPGYRFLDRWTGWDSFVLGGQEERFGVLFRSIASPPTYIFAFRGTDSDLDIWNDLFAETTTFVPYDSSKTPQPPAYVSAGFYGIYSLTGGSMQRSMQQQVFALLQKYGIDFFYITGHSLGAALSSLFTLDVRLTTPHLRPSNMNFASPMVGTERWAQVYAQQGAPTRRVFNYYDYAPDLPPLPYYTHVGTSFQCAFYEYNEWYPHLLNRHRMLNLQTVLNNAVWRTPQIWIGYFPDAVDPSVTMISVPPPVGERPGTVAALREVKRREHAPAEAAAPHH
ncbi:MAG TPA: lipase family protein [Kofleriaceae bacterium]